MKHLLEHFIRSVVFNHNEKEIGAILNIFETKVFEKGDVFKQSYTISKKLGFITSGSVKVLITHKNGSITTANILQENKFMIDLISIKTHKPTAVSIEFLETSSVLVTSVVAMDRLLKQNLTFNILIREHISEIVVALGKRHLLFLTSDSRERYQFILNNYPTLMKKFPLRLIASMIGITPTQLSRVRKNIKN
ncbi:hypothetical protein GCM10022393_23660 [Aquimarina addita]|uniref:Cyclic nucleotide-binding domain-containing protein n=1 Tax=Aquimarina addita TaxID=870485 RepID=A0ABP6UKM9_9FLAO